VRPLAAIVAGAIVGAAPQPAATTPDRAAYGAGSIAGIVSVAGDRGPARRAMLTLTGAAFPDGVLAIADDEGRYEFPAVPRGRYTLEASKFGYVTNWNGSTRPGRGPGVPVDVGDAPVRADFALLPGAAITGTVRDHFGRARPLQVRVLERRVLHGQAVWAAAQSATALDTGEYGLYGLAPGAYVIVVWPGPWLAGARVPSDAEFTAAARGTPLPVAGPTAPVRQNLVYAPTLHPGVTDPAHAEPIVLATGEERRIDLTARLVPSARLEGRVVDPAGGAPRNLQLSLLTPEQRMGYVNRELSGVVRPAAVVVTRDGAFSRSALAPGRYTFVARADGEAPASLWAIADLDVNGADVADLVIRLEHGLRVGGRLVFDAAPGTPLPDPDRMRIRLTTMSGVGLSAAPARTRGDGSFLIEGVAGGKYRLDVDAPGWTLISGRDADGNELLDRGLEVVAGRPVESLVLTATNRAPAIAGRLIGARGEPATTYSVVLISADEAHWHTLSRRTRLARPDAGGRYAFEGLPPGDYLVAAVSDADGFEFSDPDVFGTVAAQAAKVRIEPYERKVLELRLTASGASRAAARRGLGPSSLHARAYSRARSAPASPARRAWR
jgi:hypothetical protein